MQQIFNLQKAEAMSTFVSTKTCCALRWWNVKLGMQHFLRVNLQEMLPVSLGFKAQIVSISRTFGPRSASPEK